MAVRKVGASTHLIVIGGEQRTFVESTNLFRNQTRTREYEPTAFIFGIDISRLVNYKDSLVSLESPPSINTVKYSLDLDTLQQQYTENIIGNLNLVKAGTSITKKQRDNKVLH